MDIEKIRETIEQGTPSTLFEGKRVLVLTPDPTRTAPLPMMIRAIRDVLLGQTAGAGRVAGLDFMVALGTHRQLSEEEILDLYGLDARERAASFDGCRFLNHRWDLPETLAKIGEFSAAEIGELTEGRFSEKLEVLINREVFDYDLILILGPVFPHEVVGFSGGNKYLFPGISGGEFLHFFHWLAAVNTCWKTIGRKDTPERELLDRAARMVPVPRHCIAMVVEPGNRLAGLFVGPPEEAWSKAADLSARIHITYCKRSYPVVFGGAPEMYDEVWTAGKVMYKLEPVVADGGRLIIYAPHIREISRTWGKQVENVGYHTSGYFLRHLERYRNVPRGILAHCALVKGLGSYENGIERPRIQVILATGIPRETCERVNIGYMDPREINLEDYRGREQEGILFVDHAGEMLHRLESDRQG